MKKILERLKKILLILYFKDLVTKYFYLLFTTCKSRLSKKFRTKLDRDLVLHKPIYYNDKLQWLKLYWRDDLAYKVADKYRVREYVSNTIGEEYLNDLYGVYKSASDIDFSKLPKKFVLKTTHGSGYNFICTDKEELNPKDVIRTTRRWLWTDYSFLKCEWVYKTKNPKIIVEKYLEDTKTKQLYDYKIYCFHGQPKFIQVDFDRFTHHKRNLYDINWKVIDGWFKFPNDLTVSIERPRNLSLMLELASKLSKRFPHCRVDFYYCNDKVIFGEITFFPESGFGRFSDKEIEIQFGELINIVNIEKD